MARDVEQRLAEDDPDSPRLADEYGIVMGRSHQEPMLRAQKEWDWHRSASTATGTMHAHPEVLVAILARGRARAQEFESIYTIGLRGQNDTAMIHGLKPKASALLEKIVASQRGSLPRRSIRRPPGAQVWGLYKEVQNYYEAGLRVPDDVTRCCGRKTTGGTCGACRRPRSATRRRRGGLLPLRLSRRAAQLSVDQHESHCQDLGSDDAGQTAYGADRIWIVNVGHFEAYELPRILLNLAVEHGPLDAREHW